MPEGPLGFPRPTSMGPLVREDVDDILGVGSGESGLGLVLSNTYEIPSGTAGAVERNGQRVTQSVVDSQSTSRASVEDARIHSIEYSASESGILLDVHVTVSPPMASNEEMHMIMSSVRSNIEAVAGETKRDPNTEEGQETFAVEAKEI